jgi:hypothetical protein
LQQQPRGPINTSGSLVDAAPRAVGSRAEALEQSGFFTKEHIGSLLATYGSVIPKVGDAAKKLGEAMSVRELASARRHVESVLQRHQKRVFTCP